MEAFFFVLFFLQLRCSGQDRTWFSHLLTRTWLTYRLTRIWPESKGNFSGNFGNTSIHHFICVFLCQPPDPAFWDRRRRPRRSEGWGEERSSERGCVKGEANRAEGCCLKALDGREGGGGGWRERGHCVSVSVPGTAWPGSAPGLYGGAKSFPQALPTPCGGAATCSIMLWSLPVFTYAS